MIFLIIWALALIAAIILYLRQIYTRFQKYGVKTINPLPFVGNMGTVIFGKHHFSSAIVNLYKTFPEEKFVGRYEFLTQAVLIRDLELVKRITIKDFEYFLDHRSMFGRSRSYFSRNLFSLTGQEWKDMRSTLSPAFTSSKIRLMVPFMVEVGDQMMASVMKKIKSSNGGYIDIECKDLTTRYANDVIASCAFGLKVDSQTDVNNMFYLMGKEITKFGFQQVIMFLIFLNAPIVARILKLDFFSKGAQDFFRNLVLDTMKDRESHNIIRPDIINLLLEAKKGKLSRENTNHKDETAGFATVEESSVGTNEVNREWSQDDLVAQAVLFFIAGFDTVSTAMTFLLYELALNPEIQDKLAEEIKEHDTKNGGKFNLKTIQEMSYLDMVVSELLRLWPPGLLLDRICIKDYNLGKPNKNATKEYIVRKGTGIIIPTFAFHRDPQYFPNPDKFDPERFSEENKHKINAMAYIPFGIGPRNCIGSRFALCEVKIMIYQILLSLEVSPCNKTRIPVKLSKTFTIQMEGGHWLRFRARN